MELQPLFFLVWVIGDTLFLLYTTWDDMWPDNIPDILGIILLWIVGLLIWPVYVPMYINYQHRKKKFPKAHVRWYNVD